MCERDFSFIASNQRSSYWTSSVIRFLLQADVLLPHGAMHHHKSNSNTDCVGLLGPVRDRSRLII